jgi:catalase
VEEAKPRPGTLPRLAAIAAIVLLAALPFAWVNGWLTPGRLTQDGFMDAFDQVDGAHPGFRRNHAKGVCAYGWFESQGTALAVSKAKVFDPGRTELVGRFSLAGGMPFQVDAPATVRSLALRFLPKRGAEWRTGMIDLPVFPVNSAQGFYDLLLAGAPDPKTGAPDPAAMAAFLGHHPESAKAFGLIKARSVSSGFADDTYNGLDAFRFIDREGHVVAVRWSAVPQQAGLAPATAGGDNALFDQLMAQVKQQPLRWRLLVTVADAGDPTADPTLPWPADRRQIDAGAIVIDRIEGEDGGRCTGVNYDPLVLPPGIEPADDPLPSARSSVYAASYTLRAGETKPPSAVTGQAESPRAQP